MRSALTLIAKLGAFARCPRARAFFGENPLWRPETRPNALRALSKRLPRAGARTRALRVAKFNSALLLPYQAFQFGHAEPRPARMDHSVTVGAHKRQIG